MLLTFNENPEFIRVTAFAGKVAAFIALMVPQMNATSNTEREGVNPESLSDSFGCNLFINSPPVTGANTTFTVAFTSSI